MPTYVKRSIRLLMCMAALAMCVSALGPASADARSTRAQVASLKRGIEFYRNATWRWQDLALMKRTPSAYHERWVNGRDYLRWMAQLWVERNAKAKKLAQNPPHKQEWLCIHGHEGSWKARTGNGYYGGLQMDLAFQRSYGHQLLASKGTADRWTVIEQMWVAERAHRSGRGFGPWPNTARMCDLL